MKYIILLFIVFKSLLGFSQPPGGGGGRPSGGGKQQNQKSIKDESKENKIVEETNIRDFAGLNYLDSKVVLKELKIKTEEEKKTIETFFTAYNYRLKEIEKEDLLLLETTELETHFKEKKALEDKDFKGMMEAKKSASIALEPVNNKTLEAKKNLNSELEAKLSEKSFKKWIKYFEKNYKKEVPPEHKDGESNDNEDNRPPRR
ncbi:hypothetical protein [uncultured Flavobacterium sp.]|uniref:hypothetical protein n=1 Tax=uncultured Flavobacterium sp. TaxID=165435 RepID=UPI0030ED7D1A